jgi:hypothetical protein
MADDYEPAQDLPDDIRNHSAFAELDIATVLVVQFNGTISEFVPKEVEQRDDEDIVENSASNVQLTAGSFLFYEENPDCVYVVINGKRRKRCR